MSNSQLNKLSLNNRTEVTLQISVNVAGDSNDEINFPNKILLIITQVSKLRKAFANNSSANRKLLKTHLHKIEQSGRFLDRFLGRLLKTGLPLIGYVIKPIDKSVLFNTIRINSISISNRSSYS